MRDEALGIGGELNSATLLPRRNNSLLDANGGLASHAAKQWCKIILLPPHEALPICF
jgi:hypothetical protein